MVSNRPEGVKDGQEIDPDVFKDPKTGKSYLYWGNGYMVVPELNTDMISIKEGNTKRIKLDATFREGTYVIHRKGINYFFWSEDDTRSPNFKVRYGRSKSPVGPIEIPEKNIVIQGI